MNSHPHQPLTPEERELAERLARLGPHDGPSPELDARILSAARQAVSKSPRRKRRAWLGLSGGAGGLVTGLGLAASLTLVVGVVWQMRPAPGLIAPDGHADTAEHVILVDSLPRAEPRERVVAPPPPDRVEPASPGQPSATAPVSKARETAPRSEVPVQSPPPAPVAETDAASGYAAPQATGSATEETQLARMASQQQAEAARMQSRQAAEVAAMAESERQMQSKRSDDPAANAARRATYTRAARATPERAERPLQQVGAAPAPTRDTAPADLAEATADDRETALASMHEVLALPLDDDSALPPAEWFERIRAREAAGDVESARESLLLLRDSHPDIPLPDDLKTLLATPPDALRNDEPGAP